MSNRSPHRRASRAPRALRVLAGVLAACLGGAVTPSTFAATFTVNSTTDAVDANPGNGICATAGGVCTLRAAIMEANTFAGADTVSIPAGTYVLTIPGALESGSASGDLDVNDAAGLAITGAGAAVTILDAGGLDRVLEIRSGPFALSGVTVQGGATGGTVDGGGINVASNNPVLFSNITIRNNTAARAGGGFWVSGSASVTWDKVTVSGNTAGTDAGGIGLNAGTFSAVNVTLSGNVATSGIGGGVFDKVSASFTNVTIVSNSAPTGSQVYHQGGGAITFKNSIVGSTVGATNCGGSISSLGNNLDSGNSCGLAAAGDLVNTNPNLGPLAYNGGQTWTHALLAGSPAIDTGTNTGAPATDQRGLSRPQDGDGNGSSITDIGAFEASNPADSCPLWTVMTTSDAGSGSLRECLKAANATAGTQTITVPAGTYILDSGNGDDAATNGDLYLASRDLLRGLINIALLLLVLTAIVSVFWSRRITRPIERLSHATDKIGQGHFDITIDVDSSDEIGTLAKSFNRMAGELDAREKALKQAEAQLVQSEKMAAFGLLGAGIAHEVKNPLAGILGCAQISLRKADQGSLLHENLKLIEKETKRCKTIIENLLKFARQEKTTFDEIDPNAPVEDAISIVHHQLELQKVKLERDLAESLPRINGNANQLQQVFMNLMINAQQAMGSEGGRVTVTTRSVAPDRIEIRVSDTGPGIPTEIQRRVFDPFFTTKPNGKGTGLGLSVTYGIVKDHGGEITLESEPGRGATFSIVLPAIATERPPVTMEADDPRTDVKPVAEPASRA